MNIYWLYIQYIYI